MRATARRHDRRTGAAWRRRATRRSLAVLLAVAVAAFAPVLAWGYWSAIAAGGGRGAAVAASVNQGAAPTGTRSGAADVDVSWG
ncbi:MAG: hypothetical protein M3O90_07680, partial [Actinomycetota bacterium]|nr:hypothetical protein [Actinomycetota bacterium]